MLHQWRNGERRRSVRHDATDYPLYFAIKKIVYLFQHCTTNIILRLLLASLLLIQTTNIVKIDGNDVLSFYMCLHCSLHFVNTLLLPNLLHLLILLAQSVQVLQYKRIRLVVYLVFGERGVFLHGGDGGSVYLEWGRGLLLAVEFLHLEHMGVAA